MALLTIPVWTIPPNWQDGVMEELEWKTKIHASVIGAEQRQALRRSPRRALEFTVQPNGVWRSYFDALLTTLYQEKFYVPLWHDPAPLNTAHSIGAVSVTVRGTHAELAQASVLFIAGDKPWKYDIVEVTSTSTVSGNTQFTVSPLTRAWPRNTQVFAAVVGQVSAQPSYTRESDVDLSASVKFGFDQANDWPLTVTPETYRGFPVVDLETNESDSQSGSYFRYATTLDNQVGRPRRQDFGGISFPGLSNADFVYGRAETETIRTLLYYLRGRRNAAWFINPTEDFKVAEWISASDTAILVERNGFTDLNGPQESRQDICIRLKNGSKIFRRIVSSALTGDEDIEEITINSALGIGVSPTQISRVSFVALGRLDQDLVQLNHQTDTEGVCSFTLAVKQVPDLRQGDDWTPPEVPMGVTGDCGPVPGGRLWVRRNLGPWNNNGSADPLTHVGGLDISAISNQPLFPFFGFNTGLAAGQLVHVNFGADDFEHTILAGVTAWGDPEITNLNNSDRAPNLFLENALTYFGSSEKTAQFIRATTSSFGKTGFYYFEVTIPGEFTLADIPWKIGFPVPQDVFVGFATIDAALEFPTTGTVIVSNHGVANLNGGLLTTSLLPADFSVGDVLGVIIFLGD